MSNLRLFFKTPKCERCGKRHNRGGERRCRLAAIKDADDQKKADARIYGTVGKPEDQPIPCPFCGCKIIHITEFQSFCRHCGTSGPGGENRQQTLTLWNTRTVRQ